MPGVPGADAVFPVAPLTLLGTPWKVFPEAFPGPVIVLPVLGYAPIIGSGGDCPTVAPAQDLGGLARANDIPASGVRGWVRVVGHAASPLVTYVSAVRRLGEINPRPISIAILTHVNAYRSRVKVNNGNIIVTFIDDCLWHVHLHVPLHRPCVFEIAPAFVPARTSIPCGGPETIWRARSGLSESRRQEVMLPGRVTSIFFPTALNQDRQPGTRGPIGRHPGRRGDGRQAHNGRHPWNASSRDRTACGEGSG